MGHWRKGLGSKLCNQYFLVREKELKEERKEVLVLRKQVRFLTVHLHDDDNTVWNGLVENSGRHELSETLHNSRYLLSKNGKALRGESKWQMNRGPYS